MTPDELTEATTRQSGQVSAREPITFQPVCREVGVSHAFLYAHPGLRTRIENLRVQTSPAPRPQRVDDRCRRPCPLPPKSIGSSNSTHEMR